MDTATGKCKHGTAIDDCVVCRTYSLKVGDRAQFTAHDHVFHDGEREGKTGTVTELRGPLCCLWRIDGQIEEFVTGTDELTPERRVGG